MSWVSKWWKREGNDAVDEFVGQLARHALAALVLDRLALILVALDHGNSSSARDRVESLVDEVEAMLK